MPKTKQHYIYDGPVYLFDKMIAPNWSCETFAVSEARARANFQYRCKQMLKLQPYAKINLPGKVVPMKTADVITLF